jgi:hypothetical protein
MTAIADRVVETTTSTGTGAVTLAGAKAGYRSFASAFGASPLVVGYAITDGVDWEVGEGTFNGTTTLTRGRVLSSSNGGSAVSFTAGSKDVWCDASAHLLSNANLGRLVAIARGWAMP